MKNFKELRIWQKGFQITINCYQIARTFPLGERFGLGEQITRAAVSIPSNIAEGSSRTSEKDYKRFIEISLGSAYELETQLHIAKRLEYGDQELIERTLFLLIEEEKMLAAFARRLSAPKAKS